MQACVLPGNKKALPGQSFLELASPRGFEPRNGLMSGFGGAKRDRTADLLHAMQALSQLSYGPVSKFSSAE